MSRLSVLLVVTAFALVAFAPTATATHEWGHRYMIFGRVIDSEGNPAQGVPVYITVETTLRTDPWMVVNTNCDGTYYSLEQTANPQRGGGLELGRMHIHNAELPSDADYTVRVLRNETSDYAEKTGQVNPQLKYSTVNVRVDEPLPRLDQCADQPGFDGFVVVGHAQRDRGNEREDLMTVEDAGMHNEIRVTLETTSGVRNMTVETNQFGDYFAQFENVTVESGARVTASWNDETRRGTVSDSERDFGVATLNVVVGERIDKTTVTVLLVVAGAIVVLGGAAFAVTKMREAMATKRARETTTRKRANR